MKIMITDNNNYNNNNNKCDTCCLGRLVVTYENSTRVRIRPKQLKARQKSWRKEKQSVTIRKIKIRSYIKKARKKRTRF